ncbi:unnamed protein product [Prunus armeniaca]
MNSTSRGLTPKNTSQLTRSREDEAWSHPLNQKPGCQQCKLASHQRYADLD